MLQLRSSQTLNPIFRFIIIVSFLAGIIACSPTSSPSKQALPAGIVIELSDAFHGRYNLQDMHGEARTQDSFAGKPTLVYFGFTTCPDVCPTGLGVMSAALNELGKNADQIQPLFITLDPERDTAQALKDYLAFEPRVLGLTGSATASEGAQDAFKVYAQRTALPDSALGYTVDHSNFFYYVNAEGTPIYALKASLTPQQLAKFIKNLS